MFGLFKITSRKGTLRRFDKTKLLFVDDFTRAQDGNNDSRTYGVYEEKSNGQGVSFGNEQNTQGIEVKESDFPTSRFEAEGFYQLSRHGMQ